MTGRPKRQHTIPRMHLKHFVGTDPKGQVWAYDAETATARSAVLENVAVIRDFYSIEQPDGTMDATIEKYLAEVEGAAIPAYNRLLAGEVPKAPDERADFARFLAYMYLRTTAMRRMAGELYGRQIQIMAYAYGSHPDAFASLIAGYERDKGRALDEGEREQLRKHLMDPTDFVFQVPKEHALEVFGAADELMELFYRMRWSLTRPLNGFFITSDNPIVRSVDPKTMHRFYGDHGFKNKTAEVGFPLSPQAQLLMSWQKEAPELGYFRRDRVEKINASLALHSERYLFAHLHDRRILRLAVKYRGAGPKVRTSGFGPKKFAKIEVPRRSWQD